MLESAPKLRIQPMDRNVFWHILRYGLTTQEVVYRLFFDAAKQKPEAARSKLRRLSVLSTATFWTFLREFSPVWPNRGGQSGGQGWRSGLAVSGGRGFKTFWPHARASFALGPLSGRRLCSVGGLVIGWRSTQAVCIFGTMLSGLASSETGVRPCWRRRVHLGCGPRYRSTSRQGSDHGTRSGGGVCCAHPHRT